MAVSSTILPSHSLHSSSLDDLMKVSPAGLVRIVGIEVENRTRWPLTQPQAFCATGKIKVPPRDVLPSFREAMVATKPSGLANGTRGSVSWLVNPGENSQSARRVVVNWANPFNYDYHNNTLAIGLSQPGYTVAQSRWTDDMHYLPHKYTDFPVRYVRKEYVKDCGQIEIDDEDLIVTGMMGTTHDAKIGCY